MYKRFIEKMSKKDLKEIKGIIQDAPVIF